MKIRLVSLTIPMVLAMAPAWGTTINDSANNNNPVQAGGAATSATLAEMQYLEVIFQYSGTPNETAYFNSTGQAMDTAGDTVNGNPGTAGTWNVQDNSGNTLTGIQLIGSGPGVTGDAASPLIGFNFLFAANCNGSVSGSCFNGTGLYSSPVAIGGSFASQIYAVLSLTFGSGFVLNTTGSQNSWAMGSDFLLGPVTAYTGTPEPASMFLIGAGLVLGVAKVRRRKI